MSSKGSMDSWVINVLLLVNLFCFVMKSQVPPKNKIKVSSRFELGKQRYIQATCKAVTCSESLG